MNRWAALVGHPVSHSLSPFLYRAFGFALEKPVRYHALDVRERKLEAAFLTAKRHGWIGWNVTLPYKTVLCRMVDELDEVARTCGALNLIRFADGKAFGCNTDAEGFLAPLKRMGEPLSGKSVLLLGAGGAARAVAWAVSREGAGEITVLNRTLEAAELIAERFDGKAGELDERTLTAELARADMVVNATSLGLGGAGTPLREHPRFKEGALAYDLVYRPRNTPFLAAARDAGARTLDGLPMLAAQAAAAWKIWFSETVPEAVLDRVYRQLESKLDEEA